MPILMHLLALKSVHKEYPHQSYCQLHFFKTHFHNTLNNWTGIFKIKSIFQIFQFILIDAIGLISWLSSWKGQVTCIWSCICLLCLKYNFPVFLCIYLLYPLSILDLFLIGPLKIIILLQIFTLLLLFKRLLLLAVNLL